MIIVNIRCAVCLLIVFLCVLISGCQQNARPYIDFRQKETHAAYNPVEASPKPLRIALASVLSPKETISHYRRIAQYISGRLGFPAVLVQRTTYEELNMLLANGEADVAFSSTGAYSAYRGMAETEILAMAEYQGTTLYLAYVIVPKTRPVEKLDDLRGKVFAFTDPLSYSGHMCIVDYLWQRREVPEKFFSRYIYTYNHDKSVWAVANNLADGASVDSMIYDYVAATKPEIAANVRIIATIGPAPTGPVVIRKNLSPELKAQLRMVFLDMDKDPQMRAALQGLLIDRFVPPQPELYEPLRRLYDRAGGLP